MPAYAWKLALLYAAQEQSLKIEKRHMEPALLAVEFFEQSISPVFDGYGQSETQKLENKILAMLEKADGHEMTNRELQRRLGIAIGYLGRIATGLMKSGIVEETYYKVVHGRQSKGLKLIEEGR